MKTIIMNRGNKMVDAFISCKIIGKLLYVPVPKNYNRVCSCGDPHGYKFKELVNCTEPEDGHKCRMLVFERTNQ